MKISSLCLGFGLFAATAMPATAQNVPEDADLLLWCGSAFAFMGGGAQTEAEMENFFIARQLVLEKAAAILYAAEFPQDRLEGLIDIYDERVLDDFESGDIPYESEDCIAAVGL